MSVSILLRRGFLALFLGAATLFCTLSVVQALDNPSVGFNERRDQMEEERRVARETAEAMKALTQEQRESNRLIRELITEIRSDRALAQKQLQEALREAAKQRAAPAPAPSTSGVIIQEVQ